MPPDALDEPRYVPQIDKFAAVFSERTRQILLSQDEIYDASIRDFRAFWRSFLDYSALRHSGDADPVCVGDDIETARFFPDLRLNYADNLLSPDFDPAAVALTSVRAGRPSVDLTRQELRDRVERLAGALRGLGLKPGDRVAAITRNNAEAMIAMLAVTALGGVYSATAPEMGADAIIDRFGQVEPVMLFANLAPEPFDAGSPVAVRVAAVAAALPSLRLVVALDAVPDGYTLPIAIERLDDLLTRPRLPQSDWPQLPFDHPVYVMFTSGTTGRPKCIVHSAGGVLLEHVKEHRLHADATPADTLFFFTSCAWMLWNWEASALASGVRIVVYDGPITQVDTLWAIVAEQRVTMFGTGPSYLRLCAESGVVPSAAFDFTPLRSIMSTGSILYDDQYVWVRDNVKNVPVHSASGGTDMLGCFVLGSPLLPVIDGECQTRSLGLDVRALGATDDEPIGELVCANPFPSRPVGFLNDPGGQRFHDAYFAQNPGFWTHGDLISFGPEGGSRLHGRSDGLLKIRGIRIGPAEIYRVVLDMPEIAAVMAIEQTVPIEFAEGRLVLLVVPRGGVAFDPALATRIRNRLLEALSAAHVPEVIIPVATLPLTHSRKQSETAMTDAINGRPVRNLSALANPESLDGIRGHAALASRGADKIDAIAAEDLGDPAKVEAYLCALWEALFSRSPISRDDDFFALGGNSLMAARMFIELRRVTGCALKMTALLHAPTIAQLVVAVMADGGTDSGQLVRLREGSAGLPFFIVHSMAGAVLEMSPLQRALTTDRPVYAIQARGLDGEEPRTSVADMARDYIALMQSVQPAGPYSVGGHSFGGLVAFEIGVQLRRAGHDVDHVVLIDAQLHPRYLPARQSLHYRLNRPGRDLKALFEAPPGQRLGYLKSKALVLFDRFRGKLGLPSLRPDLIGAIVAEAHLPPELRRVRGAILIAARKYRPTMFDGRVTYVRPEIPGEYDAEPVWRRLAGRGIDVRVTPGDHLTMITDHVRPLAAIVDDCLTRQTS